jgi:putative YphP/YqiW family bacilliredoxin
MVAARQELTNWIRGRTPEQVDSALKTRRARRSSSSTRSVVVQRNARPAVTMALRGDSKPQKLATVFAGQDVDATQRAREYFTGYPPSSPSIGLLKDGQLVYMMERWQIEGRPAQDIAEDLVGAVEKFC